MMPQQAIAGLGAGLFTGVGNVPAQQHAPVLAIDGLAVLGGGGAGAGGSAMTWGQSDLVV